MSSTEPVSLLARDYRVDFVRGLALLVVFSDHVAGNVLWHFAPTRWGLSDMAETFVFLSGFVCGMTYSRKLRCESFLSVQRKATLRAGQLYLANLIALSVLLPMVWFLKGCEFAWIFGNAERLGTFLLDPLAVLQRTLLLGVEPKHFAILPLYIVLTLAIPTMLALMRCAPAVTLTGSGLLYIAVQWAPDMIALPQPWRTSWYFNPFAWQLLFFGGAAFSVFPIAGRSRIPRSTQALIISIVLLEAAFLATVLLPECAIPCTGKAELGPLRIVHLGCLLVSGRALLPSSEAIRVSRLARPMVLCGQNSLVTYCTGGLLAIGGSLILASTSGGLGWQVLINGFGWAGCVEAAWLWSRIRNRWRSRFAVSQASHDENFMPHIDSAAVVPSITAQSAQRAPESTKP